jgi:threonyl-tRNA synthetase
MERIIKARLPLRREEVSREEARQRIEAINEPYKLEILDSIKVRPCVSVSVLHRPVHSHRHDYYTNDGNKQTEPITIYHIGEEWWDLCAGPHVESTGDLPANAIKLESLVGCFALSYIYLLCKCEAQWTHMTLPQAGAYWRGDEKRAMLTRIYGTAWESKDQLKVCPYMCTCVYV